MFFCFFWLGVPQHINSQEENEFGVIMTMTVLKQVSVLGCQRRCWFAWINPFFDDLWDSFHFFSHNVTKI
jgi:hypothetical protein